MPTPSEEFILDRLAKEAPLPHTEAEERPLIPPKTQTQASEEAATANEGRTETGEIERAVLYRANWDAKIAFRANQLRQMSGQTGAFNILWDNWQNIYRPDNFIQSLPDMDIPGEEGYYITPFDIDVKNEGAGSVSSSPVRVRNARHASDQNP